jgi:hypothetical protein
MLSAQSTPAQQSPSKDTKMAIKVSNTEVVSNTRELKNIAAVDDGTVSVLNTALSQVLSTDPTRGTLTKSFVSGETASITLSSALSPAPVVSATKEVPQTGIISKGAWDVASNGANYDRLDTAYDTTLTPTLLQPLGSATYTNKTVSVSSQETTPAALRFKPDGTKMYVMGYSSDYVNEYTMSTPWNISNALYTRRFSVGSQEPTPQGLAFNADGTKMFIVGGTRDVVYQYTLSTAWLVTSASLASGNKSVSSQLSAPNGLMFNADGTKMYVVGYQDNVYEYDLSSAYDVSTAQYNSVNLTITGQESQARDIYFNANGTKLYVIGTSSDSVHQYGLTTAYDLSTASYDSVSFSVSSQENSPQSVAFRPDGTYFYIVGIQWDRLREYEVPSSDLLVLGTGSFASTDVGKTIEGNGGVAVLTAADGSYVETTAFTDRSTIAAGDWSLSGIEVSSTKGLRLSFATNNTWNLAAAVYSQNFSVVSQDNQPRDLFFKPDGTKMYILGSAGDDVGEYNLSTAWDVTTSVYSQNFLVGYQDTNPTGMFFKPDGTKMYILGDSGNDVNEYNLSTAWDVTTAVYSQLFFIGNQEIYPTAIFFKPDGTKMYILGLSGDDVNEYNLSTAWDVTTSVHSQDFYVGAQDTNPKGMFFKHDGTKMYILGDAGVDVNEYNLNTAWNISTASFLQNFSVSAQETGPTGMFFKPDGTKMYILGWTGDEVNEYAIGSLAAPTLQYLPAVTSTSGQIDSAFWTDINSMTPDEISGDGEVYYAVSTDDRTTWSVINEADGVRPIVRDNAGTWECNSLLGGYGLSHAAFVAVSTSLDSQDGSSWGIALSSDGTKLYQTGNINNSIFQYTLSTAWDISTVSYDSVSFSVSSQTGAPFNVHFSSDGTVMYVSDNTVVYQYTLSTAWDISTASYASKLFNFSSLVSAQAQLEFKSDGTVLLIGGYSTSIYQFTLSTAWDVSTATYSGKSFTPTLPSSLWSINANDTGTKVFLGYDDNIKELILSTAWDISTASYSGVSYDASAHQAWGRMWVFGDSGSKLYSLDDLGGQVHQYSSPGYTTSAAWTSATTNSELYALQQALTDVSINRMDKTQLEAVTDPNHYTLGDSLDLMIGLYLGSASSDVPSSDGVSINYDATTLNQGAVLGTDYDFDFPDSTTVRVTSNATQNLKVRVV